MKPIRLGAVLAAYLLLPACAANPRIEKPQVTRPGWECTIGLPGQDKFTANAVLSQNGLQESARWSWHTGGRFLGFGLKESIQGDRQPDHRHSTFVVHWGRETLATALSNEVRLELTSDPDWPGWFTEVPFAGQYSGGNGASIDANWPDATAFARGANTLTIIARERNGRVVDRQPFPNTIFAQAEAAAKEGLVRLAAKMSRFETECAYIEDLDFEFVVN